MRRDLDLRVRVEAGVQLDGVADGLEHLAHVGGDVDEHERVELGRELRRGGGAGKVRADEADRVRAGDGGAEERDGARLRVRRARLAQLVDKLFGWILLSKRLLLVSHLLLVSIVWCAVLVEWF